jgi:hypothetical protein
MLFKSIVSAAVFAVAAVAQIQFTNTPTAVAVGSTYQLTWTGGDSTAVRYACALTDRLQHTK